MKHYNVYPLCVLLVLAAGAFGVACKRAAPEESGRPRPTAPPPQTGVQPEKTCIGKNLADKAMLGAAREAEHGCPSSLDGKLYITSQWPPAITLDYQENPALDSKFTATARQIMPSGDPVHGPPCCYVTTKARPK